MNIYLASVFSRKSFISDISTLLPVTTDPIDVRLVFEGVDNPNLTLPAVKWESEDEPNIVEGYVYDILFQYIDDKIGWLAGYIKYA